MRSNIIKLVDEPAAVPGDVVTFTIRYENIGDRELYNIRIVDNLTPRLELLPGTTNSDREGEFAIEDNTEGSVVLTFQLAAPLPGKTAGTLRFQCRGSAEVAASGGGGLLCDLLPRI